jgi:hypothetical protein
MHAEARRRKREQAHLGPIKWRRRGKRRRRRSEGDVVIGPPFSSPPPHTSSSTLLSEAGKKVGVTKRRGGRGICARAPCAAHSIFHIYSTGQAKGAPGVQSLSGCPGRRQAGEKGLNSAGWVFWRAGEKKTRGRRRHFSLCLEM